MWDDFLMKQDEPLYIRNVLSGLAGIMLVRPTSVVGKLLTWLLTHLHVLVYLSW